MAALQTTTRSQSSVVEQIRSSPKRELGNGFPKGLAAGITSRIEDVSSVAATKAATDGPTSVPRDGLMARVTSVLLAFYDSLSRPAMSKQERIQLRIAAARREQDKFWSGTDVFWGP